MTITVDTVDNMAPNLDTHNSEYVSKQFLLQEPDMNIESPRISQVSQNKLNTNSLHKDQSRRSSIGRVAHQL